MSTNTPKITKHVSGEYVSYIAHNVQGGWPDLYQAVPFKNDPKNTPRFGITIFIPKGTEGVEVLQADIAKLAKDKLKLNKLPDADSCLKDGDESENEAYHGHWIFSAYAYPDDKKPGKGAPTVVDGKKVKIPEGDSKAPYSGSVSNIVFDIYTSPKWKKVNGGLKTVQALRDGPVIGRSQDLSDLPDVEEEIEDLDGNDGLD